jgi:phosphoribosyl-ATP pyrophosphohydrolase/phosphoribosyl-AMP cyclohydrolase
MDYSKLSGLIPAVIQDDTSGEVLMVGFMNDEALARTRLKVTSMLVDCDDDTVLLKVTRLGDGNVCHTGTRTCFRVME